MGWIAADGVEMSAGPDDLAAKAQAAIESMNPGEVFDDDSVTDMITNIFHLMERDGMNKERILSMARNHWEQEKDGREV